MSAEQILGLVTGVLFGILLQKGRVLRFEKQVAAMQLKDMTIMKFMLSAIFVGMVGIAALESAGVITVSHKPMNLGAVILGGALFGVGWAFAGFCPGTAVGAVGEGRWHALFAVIGMIAGAAIYAACFPFLSDTLLAWKDYGRLGLPDALGISRWVIIPVFGVLFLGVFAWFESRRI